MLSRCCCKLRRGTRRATAGSRETSTFGRNRPLSLRAPTGLGVQPSFRLPTCDQDKINTVLHYVLPMYSVSFCPDMCLNVREKSADHGEIMPFSPRLYVPAMFDHGCRSILMGILPSSSRGGEEAVSLLQYRQCPSVVRASWLAYRLQGDVLVVARSVRDRDPIAS